MNKKLLCLIMAALLSFLPLATLAEEAQNVIVVGTNPEFAPFEFVGDDGTVQGIDVDVITAIAEEMGATVQIEAMEFSALIPALTSGKIDMIIAGMTINDERKRSVAFSDPYFDATQSIIIREGDERIGGPDDLNGMKIGVQMGTTGDLYCTDEYPEAEVVRFDKAMDAVLDLSKGSLDAVVVDEAPANNYASMGENLIVLPDRLSEEQYGIAMPLGSDELVEKVNAALANLVESGAYDEILTKYGIK